MECNRDEALRAKEIAEKKFAAKDIIGAKKFALKAQILYPTLDGISQMISTLDIYLSAEVRVNGERDWYAILSVNASADDELVKKQYRKLALMLHPDKNKSVGAEGAFQLISEAWSVLSDKSKRFAYDQKRNIKVFQQKVPQPSRGPSFSNTNGFSHFTNSATSNARTQKNAARAAHTAVPTPTPPPKLDTFWTSCKRCKMQYEYLRVFVNQNLLCPNCKEPFLAVEIGSPTNGPNRSVSSSASQQHQQKSNHSTTRNNAHDPGKNDFAVPGLGHTGFQHGPNVDSLNNPNFHWGAFSRTAGAASAAVAPSAAAQASNIVHQTYEKVRREREEAQAAAKREEAVRRKNHISKRTASGVFAGNSNASLSGNIHNRDHPIFPKVDRPAKKRRSMGEDRGNDFRGDDTEGRTSVPNANKGSNTNTGVLQMEKMNDVSGDSVKARVPTRLSSSLSKEFSQLDIRNMLIQKAIIVVKKKLEDCTLAAAAAKLAEIEKGKQKQKQKEIDKAKETAAVYGDTADKIKVNASCNGTKEVPGKEVSSNDTCIDAEEENQENDLIDVPDPDFHDFDNDRLEESFEADQIWATYDSEDGMPRDYALIQKVISLKPFKIRISFFKAKSNSEFSELNWVGLGFAKTCGDFRVGRRYEDYNSVNFFSHRVRWEKGAHGVIRITPRKGDTWALYRNWSPDWDEHTPDDVMYKYDMVEVLEDYNEEQGVAVTPLVKVAGFKTVFHRHLDPKEVKKIPKGEMFRFSHQVPSHLLTGEEAQNAPKGCRELDPAATPSELLQVITEAKEEEMVETAEQQAAS